MARQDRGETAGAGQSTTAIVLDAEMLEILRALAFLRARRRGGGRPSVSAIIREVLDKHRTELKREAKPVLDLK